MDAGFIISAASPEQFPPESAAVAEIAFLGRSNVGKSSLLNALVGKEGLAFTSARPGCTQTINFYKVAGGFHFVDLPGYGYARVPLEIRSEWKNLIELYLLRRRALRLSVLVMDARRGWMEPDLELKRWLDFHRRPYVLAVTKFDKLKTEQDRKQGLAAFRVQMPDGELVPFSARTGRGVREIWQAIRKTKTY